MDIVKFWNLLHYYLFIWQKYGYKLLNYINPFTYIFKIPSVKAFYAKKGISDMNVFFDKQVLNTPLTGINITWAAVHIGGLLVILEYGIFNFLQYLTEKPLIKFVSENDLYRILFILMLLIPSFLFNYYTIFKDNKYLYYFKKFENIQRQDRIKYGWICFLFLIGIWSFLILSFILLNSLSTDQNL